MKKTNRSSTYLRYTFTLFGAWWALAALLATVQAYNTYRSFFVIVLGVALTALVFYMHLLLGEKVSEKNKVARIIAFGYAGIHFIPLLAQFLTLKEPGLDNLITALLGLVILVFLDESLFLRHTERQ